jgi:FkbM family methyltransferase
MKGILNALKYKIINKFKKQIEIPTYEKKRSIIDNYKNEFGIETFVETGTFLGDTVEFFKNKFDKVYSIELSEDLANRAIERFNKDRNVEIIQGDSGTVLHDLVENLQQSAIFWLDGHYSSEFFVGTEFIKTARSDKNTPIENELKAIFRSKATHIILIDDARLFIGENDYPTIDALKKIIKNSRPEYAVTVDTDIIRVVPKRNKRQGNDSEITWKSKKGVINKEFIRQFLPPNPIIIDAGAHRGDDSIEFCQLIPSSEIHAFEPVPAIFDDLSRVTALYKQIKCYKLALSDRTGQQEMHISSGGSDASSSLLAPRDHLKDHPDTFFNEKIRVNTITLDDWAEENKILKVDFLWLDMQGFELGVLKASTKIFPKVAAIHIEVSTKQTYENVPHYDEVKAWMESNGFIARLEEIPRGWDMGNVLFIRNFR